MLYVKDILRMPIENPNFRTYLKLHENESLILKMLCYLFPSYFVMLPEKLLKLYKLSRRANIDSP